MDKKTENEENLKRYQARLAELQAEGELVPSPALPTGKLIQHLVTEGEKLLAKPNRKVIPKKTSEKTKLSNTLGLTSKNPYVRARTLVLQSYPQWRQKEIETMELTQNLDNHHYMAFVRQVIEKGDLLSDKK